jgi:hypothetical protein
MALASFSGELDIALFDETLRRDAAEPPELDELRQRLADAPPPPSDAELDERQDRIDERLDRQEEEPDAPDRPIDQAAAAMDLVCGVLRNSELVNDLPLKARILKESIKTLSLLAVVSAVLTEDDEIVTAIRDLASSGSTPGQTLGTERAIRRLMRMITLVLVGLAASALLGSSHLGVAIESALSDEEIRASPTRSWMLTMIYCHLQLPSWPDRLRELYERYPEHAFLREVIGTYALDLHHGADSDDEALKLEAFLADAYFSQGRGGPAGVPQRAADRSQYLEMIRSARRRFQHLRPGATLDDEVLESE